MRSFDFYLVVEGYKFNSIFVKRLTVLILLNVLLEATNYIYNVNELKISKIAFLKLRNYHAALVQNVFLRKWQHTGNKLNWSR